MAFLCGAYLDESGTEGPLMAVSICVGSVGKWASFERNWLRMLEREMKNVPPQKRYFHMRDLEKREKNFKGWDDTKANRVLTWAVAEVKKATFFAHTAAFKLEDYFAVASRYPGAPGKYAFAVTAAMQSAMPTLKKLRPDIALTYRLEWGARGWKQMRAELDLFLSDHRKDHYRCVSAEFGQKTDWPGLQAADIVVYETRKYLDQKMGFSGRRTVRPSLVALPRPSWSIGVLEREHVEKLFEIAVPPRIRRVPVT